MKKLAFIIFGVALIIGMVIANFTSFGSGAVRTPLSFIFGSRTVGSGNTITENRNIGEFSAVEVGGILRVEIQQGEKRSVRVEADDNIVPLVRTEVNDGTLEIFTDRKFKTKNRVTVFVTSPVIEMLETSGVVSVTLTKVEGNLLKVHSSGASKIETSGKVENLEVEMSGASKIRAGELSAVTADVEGSGASSLFVEVKETLTANVSGASSVNYSGDVSELKKSVSGAGSIRRIK